VREEILVFKSSRWTVIGGAIIVVLLGVVGAIYVINQSGDRGHSDFTNQNVPTDDDKNYKNITLDDVNTCSLDSDCILVEAGVCGLTDSIHRDHQQIWEQHQEWLIKKEGLVICEPALPKEMFEPRCVNTRCEAVLLQNQAVLEFEDTPLLGKPARLTFSFEFSEDKTGVAAQIHLPDGVKLIEGDPVWKGDLPQSEEKVLELAIQVNEPGHYQIEGTVDVSKGYPPKVRDTVDMEVTPQETYLETRPANHWEQQIGYALPNNQEQLSSELVIEPKPGLGEIFTITYRVKPLIEVYPQSMQSNLSLPENAFDVMDVQYPEGGETRQSDLQFTWLGSPHKGEMIEIKLTLKPISTGWGFVIGNTFIQESNVTDTVLVDVYVGKLAGGYTARQP
jgi:hypothetical protein